MKAIFLNENSTLLGFSFNNDLNEFQDKSPHFTFFQKVANFVDIQDYYGELHAINNQIGLLKVSEELFGKPLCKHEQISNWEKRPLRLS